MLIVTSSIQSLVVSKLKDSSGEGHDQGQGHGQGQGTGNCHTEFPFQKLFRLIIQWIACFISYFLFLCTVQQHLTVKAAAHFSFEWHRPQ